MAHTKAKPLRTRQEPDRIKELLSIANKLRHAASPDHINRSAIGASIAAKIPRTLARTLVGSHVHDAIINAHRYGHDEETIRYYLGRAVEKLPAELQAFVKPGNELLKQGAKPWLEIIGAWLYNFALGGSGGLMFPETEDPWFTEGEVESMRQRYLFLFAVREILKETSRACVSLDEAGRRLSLLHTYSTHSSSALAQVKNLRSQLYVSSEETREGTHKLAVYYPLLFRVLEGVEAERIRECPICEKLFWAGRLDQTACSTRCANVRRGRIHREKYHKKHKH